MNKITDITLKSHLDSLIKPQQTSPVTDMGQKFGAVLKNTIEQVNNAQVAADKASQQVVAGETKNLHEAMIKLEEADISMRLMVQVRNKALDAYHEIMRMSV